MMMTSDVARARPGDARLRIGGRYSLGNEVPKGDGNGERDAFDEVMQRSVAVRMCHVRNARRRARFWRAALAASQLAHPNIVRVYDFGVEDDLSFVVVERAAGAQLARAVDECGAFPWPRAVHVLRQLCAAVAATHQGEDDGANECVADLDASRVHLCDVEGMRDFVKVHVAPFRRVDRRRDVRALGGIAWRLLVGSPLPSMIGARLRIPNVREHVDVPPGLEDIVMSALDARRALRPSAVEMFAALRTLMPGR